MLLALKVYDCVSPSFMLSGPVSVAATVVVVVVVVVVFAPVVFVVLSPIVTSVSYIVISLLLLLDPLPQSHLHSPAPPHNVVDPSLESL